MSVKILYEGGASGVLFQDRRSLYLDPKIVYSFYKDETPFLTLLSKLQTKKVDDRLFKLFEDRPTFPKQQFTVNVASDVTVPANGSESDVIGVENQINLPSVVSAAYKGLEIEIWNSTLTTKKGVVVITDTPSESSIKVKSAKNVQVTVSNGDIGIVIGSVRGEVSVAPDGWSDELRTVWNSTQFFSTAVEISKKLKKAAEAAGFKGSPELARLRLKKLQEFKMQIQNAFLRGVSTVGTNMNGSDTFHENNLRTITDKKGNTSHFYTTYGYIPILEDYGITWNGSGSIDPNTNIFKIPNASLNYAKMTEICEVIFDKRTSDQAVAFVGSGVISILAEKAVDNSKFGFQGKMQLGDEKISQLGFRFRELITGHGSLYLVATKALNQTPYRNSMLIPSVENMGIAEFEPFEYKTNVQVDDDYSAQKDVYNYDAGIWMTLLETHHMITIV